MEAKETWTVVIIDGYTNNEMHYEVPEEVGELVETVSEERDYYKEIVENVVFGKN